MTLFRNVRFFAAIAIAASVVAGCSEPSTGDPRPIESTTVSSSQRPSADRPREIKLDDKDPCSLTEQADWSKFKIEKPGKSKQNETFKVPECFYSTSMGGFSIVLNTTEGIGAWDESQRDIKVKDVDPIEGFRALQLDQRSPAGACSVVVDVADGQTLDSFVVVRSEQIDEKCGIAYEFAKSAMKTLLGGN